MESGEVVNVARGIVPADETFAVGQSRFSVAMRTITPEYLAWAREVSHASEPADPA